MNAYDSTLTRFNLAVNSYCAIRFELPHSKQEQLVFEHAKKVRDAAEEFLATAKERSSDRGRL